MSQLVLDVLIGAAKDLGHPVEGKFAFNLWLLCSGVYGLKPQDATKVYNACGYEAFKGYPLTKLSNRMAA